MSAYLASIVKGEPEEEDVREELNNAEESINNPVGEPLCVILLNIALDGLNTE